MAAAATCEPQLLVADDRFNPLPQSPLSFANMSGSGLFATSWKNAFTSHGLDPSMPCDAISTVRQSQFSSSASSLEKMLGLDAPSGSDTSELIAYWA